MKDLLDNRNLFTALLLVLVTVVANTFFFSKQLHYGFRDVDWQVLYYFKLFGNLSFNHLLQEIKVLGVYIPESYYVGLLEKFLGLNFANLHQVTHIFKIISALSVYLLILKIFKSKLLAFISSFSYTISYTHAGALFQLSSGGYFLVTTAMNLFLITYYFSLTKRDFLKWSLLAGILLILTFALKPERMYPLIPLVFLIEFFVIVTDKFSKELLAISLKRILFILLPLLILFPFYRVLFTNGVPVGFAPNQFLLGTSIKIKSILSGNLQLLVEPFASLGSIFLYEDYWKLLGRMNFANLETYIFSLIFGPVLKLGLVSFFLLSIIVRKSFKLSMLIMTLIFIFGMIIYMININWQNIAVPVRIHFDPNLIAMPSIMGFYLIVLNFVFFISWLRSRENILLAPILGITFAFFLIILTWISSDIVLVFMGPQRYLSIPSIGTSLFIASLAVISFYKLRAVNSTKQFAWVVFLILAPLILINHQVTNKFFDYELTYAGLRVSEQVRMKSKFRQLAGNINMEDKSLFYFDEIQDRDNGYFDEGTTIAGFEFWTRVKEDGTLNNFPAPGIIRTNVQCPKHTHQNCINILKDGLRMENGQLGIWYQDPIRGNIPKFYKISNFHAVRFINKDLINITEEVLKELNL